MPSPVPAHRPGESNVEEDIEEKNPRLGSIKEGIEGENRMTRRATKAWSLGKLFTLPFGPSDYSASPKPFGGANQKNLSSRQ